ncbi:ABC transporter ATP-binding protein [Bacillus sp. TS-2]|nr:ABC transporter ATP-binding protein [Bacillus sp. TS-2]
MVLSLKVIETNEPMIEIENLSKSFSIQPMNPSFVLDKVHLHVKKGEFYILLGPSGCGKSTLLNLIAGFIQPTSGQLLVDGMEIKEPSSERGMMFQQADSSLYPWLTVQQNVEFGLKMKKVKKSQREEVSKQYIELVGLNGHEKKYPKELSGGMKQRVQLARVLANDPDILLMDEPFGALDAMTRKTMQNELIRIWRKTKKTVIFVTHDLQEALLLGQRIGVMSVGPNSTITDQYVVDIPYPRDITDEKVNEKYAVIQRHFEH